MKRTSLRALGLAVTALSFGSCAFDDLDDPQWRLDMLGPLATASANVQDVEELTDFSFSFTTSFDEIAEDAGISDQIVGGTFVPGGIEFGPVTLGPYVSDNVQEAFSEIEVSSATMSVTVSNDLPVVIRAGTRLSLTSQGAELFSGDQAIVLDSDLGRGETFTATGLTFTDVQLVADQIEFSLVEAEGETLEATLLGGESISIDFALTEANIESVSLASGKTFGLEFIESFELEGSEVSIADVDGLLTLRAKNEMPFSFTLDAELRDTENGPAVFPIASNESVAPAETDSEGNVTAMTQTDIVLDISGQYDQIRGAQFIYIQTTIDAVGGGNSPVVTATLQDSLKVVVIGDLELQVND